MRDQSINNNTNTNSKSPSVKDALGILNNTKQIIENIGLEFDEGYQGNNQKYKLKK